MDDPSVEDTNSITKRKFESSDVEEDGSNVKRSKASTQTPTPSPEEVEDFGDQLNLLHFSDDVMLCILHYCSPRELKALSFCCQRLARLCMDRSLWRVVELRQQALGARALSFYARCLKSSTSSLFVRGLIGSGCLKDRGIRYVKHPVPGPSDCDCVNSEHVRKWPIVTDTVLETGSTRSNQNDVSEQGPSKVKTEASENENSSSSSSTANNLDNESFPNSDKPGPSTFSSQQSAKESGNTSPKPFYSSYKDPSLESENSETSGMRKKPQSKNKPLSDVAECCKFGSVCLATVTKNIIVEIRQKCTNLRDLRLEYCNLNCNSFPISYFPKTLKVLSLKGCKRSSAPFQKPYLFKIHDHLPELEELDLSYCRWLSGHSLLLLSKMLRLKKLWLRGCIGLGECVAYASLSTRFGFKSLEVLDVRGTPMSDSEVSSFSFLANLRELYLEPPFTDVDIDAPIGFPEHSGLMEPWELEHPRDEVDEYIDIMNKDDFLPTCSVSDFDSDNIKSSNDKAEGKINSETNNSSVENEDDPRENVGVFYRSVVNLSYEERNHDNVDQNAENVNRPNNYPPSPPPPPPPRRPIIPNADNGVEVQVGPVGVQVGHVGVQVGPVGVQVGHGGVQVGPVRLQMRQAMRGDRPMPENGAQPGLGGVQVGPVEVQVGPEGVQVGLGDVRVDPGWVRGGPDGGVQVELGGVRVDRRWMQIAPGVHVGIQGVEVQAGQERRPEPEVRNEDPVGVHVGPIEVQVRPLRVEIGREGRQARPEDGRQIEDILPHLERQENQVPEDANGQNDNANADNGQLHRELRNVALNFHHALDPWLNAYHDNPEPRLQIGFNVRRRGGLPFQRNRGLNEDGVQAQEPQQVNNDQNPQAAPRNPDDNMQDNGAQNGEEQENNRAQVDQRNERQNLPRGPCRHRGFMNVYRLGSLPPAPGGPHVQFRDRVLFQRSLRRPGENMGDQGQPPVPEREAGNRQNDNQNNVNPQPAEQNRQVDPAEQDYEHLLQVHPPEFARRFRRVTLARIAGQPRQPGQARPEEQANRPYRPMWPHDLRPYDFDRPDDQPGPNGPPVPDRPDEQPRDDVQPRADGQARPDENIQANAQARPEWHPRAGRHNIMDGRVHVIYVNPQYPRRLAADVLVAAGMPRNAGLMMYNDGGNALNGDFEFQNVQHVLDVQFPFLAQMPPIGGADLVTDASLLHFGDSEHLVRVGGSQIGRQRYSPLEILYCRGYRGVTDQSLAHLATAAPSLRHLDVTGCGITNSGVAAFTMHRPDCILNHIDNESSN